MATKKKVKKWNITVKDYFHGVKLTGEFEGATVDKAIAGAKEFYALELDTTVAKIEVVKIVEL